MGECKHRRRADDEITISNIKHRANTDSSPPALRESCGLSFHYTAPPGESKNLIQDVMVQMGLSQETDTVISDFILFGQPESDLFQFMWPDINKLLQAGLPWLRLSVSFPSSWGGPGALGKWWSQIIAKKICRCFSSADF